MPSFPPLPSSANLSPGTGAAPASAYALAPSAAGTPGATPSGLAAGSGAADPSGPPPDFAQWLDRGTQSVPAASGAAAGVRPAAAQLGGHPAGALRHASAPASATASAAALSAPTSARSIPAAPVATGKRSAATAASPALTAAPAAAAPPTANLAAAAGLGLPGLGLLSGWTGGPPLAPSAAGERESAPASESLTDNDEHGSHPGPKTARTGGATTAPAAAVKKDHSGATASPAPTLAEETPPAAAPADLGDPPATAATAGLPNAADHPAAAGSGRPGAPPEKIAAHPVSPDAGESPGQSAGDKNSLMFRDKQDTYQVSSVGTAGAKTQTAMAAPALSHSRSAEFTSVGAVTAPPTASAATGAPAASTAAANATAREAVEQVAKLADAQAHQSANGVQSVNLGFKFGDTTLGVRVALQGGTVHTQFNTDSSDLRSAIAAQWQSLSSGSATRAYHFSDPVFASAGGNSADLSSGSGGGAAQREQLPGSALPRALFSSASPAVPTSAPASPSSTPSATVVLGRLHAFA